MLKRFEVNRINISFEISAWTINTFSFFLYPFYFFLPAKGSWLCGYTVMQLYGFYE